MAARGIGAMRESLSIQRNDAPVLSVSSLTRSSTTATVTTAFPHGYAVGDYVTVAGSLVVAWNAKWKIVTVPSATTFTFTCGGSITTPATGTVTVVYTSNASGGQGTNFWRTLATVSAEMIPIGAMERLQIQAVQSDVKYRFRVRARADYETTMRVLWMPSWPPGSTRSTLEVTGVLPVDDGRFFQFLECSEVAA